MNKLRKSLNIILILALIVSLGVNLRGYWVINDLMEGNIELIAKNFNTNTKIKSLIQNNHTEEALEILDKKIKIEGILLGITALSENSQILEEKIKE